MGLNYSERVDAYQTLSELMQILKDLIKNPPNLKPSVDEAISAANDARSEISRMEARRAEIAESVLSLNKFKKVLDDTNLAQQAASNDLNAKASQLKTREIEIEARHQSVRNRENAIVDKEGANEKKASELALQKTSLSAAEDVLADRESAVKAREDKIREALK